MKKTGKIIFRSGFTLIEIMVAMMILSVLIAMVGNIFQQVSSSWNIGTQSADANTSARAALNFIAQELAQAVAGTIECAPGATPSPNSSLVFKVNNRNELKFVALAGKPNSDDRRALRGAIFRLETAGDFENTLRYRRVTGSNPYRVGVDDWNDLGIAPIISNVVGFQAFVYADYDGVVSTGAAPATCSFSKQLPLCVDLYLELLSSDDMQRYESLKTVAPLEVDGFLDRSVQSYSTRVYLMNRRGYAGQ